MNQNAKYDNSQFILIYILYRIDECSASIHYNLANLMEAEMKDYETAAVHYIKCLSIDNTDSDVLNNYGMYIYIADYIDIKYLDTQYSCIIAQNE